MRVRAFFCHRWVKLFLVLALLEGLTPDLDELFDVAPAPGQSQSHRERHACSGTQHGMGCVHSGWIAPVRPCALPAAFAGGWPESASPMPPRDPELSRRRRPPRSA